MAGKQGIEPDRGDTPHPGVLGLATRAVHAGRAIDPHTGSLVPPIVMSTTFARGEDGELLGEHLYGRHSNPNRSELERCLADLEGAAAAMAFSSGCAAAHTLLSCMKSGDVIVLSDDMYFGIRNLMQELCPRVGIVLREADLTDVPATGAALVRPQGSALLVLCETPTNPRMRVVDIAALAQAVHAAHGELVVDNTMATPILQAPFQHGADYVMHSTTKFLGGHSDVIGGALLCRDPGTELWRRATLVQMEGGAVPSPFDCWLLLRGLATLELRVTRQVDNAERLAALLAAHPGVDRVLYPGLSSHPGHEIARVQMRRPGAMLSVLLRGGDAEAARFVSGLHLIQRATSLGGVHSLAEHRARVEGPGTRTPPNLVRLSVGIEAYEDLAHDVASALTSL